MIPYYSNILCGLLESLSHHMWKRQSRALHAICFKELKVGNLGDQSFVHLWDRMFNLVLKNHDGVEESSCLKSIVEFEFSFYLWLHRASLLTSPKLTFLISRLEILIQNLLYLQSSCKWKVEKSKVTKLAVPNAFPRIGAWISFSKLLIKAVLVHTSPMPCRPS